MFSYLKKSLGFNDIWADIVKEVDVQKDIIKEINNIRPSEEDEGSIIIREATRAQAKANIDALIVSLNRYMTQFHNTNLKASGVEKYLSKELPKECAGFVYNINVKGYKRDLLKGLWEGSDIGKLSLDDFEKYRDYLDFWKGSKFNTKFQKLFVDKFEAKLIEVLREVDPKGAAFLETNWSYNNKYQAQYIDTLIRLIEAYFVIEDRSKDPSKQSLEVILLNHRDDNVLIELIRNCQNFKAMVFAEGHSDGILDK